MPDYKHQYGELRRLALKDINLKMLNKDSEILPHKTYEYGRLYIHSINRNDILGVFIVLGFEKVRTGIESLPLSLIVKLADYLNKQ